MPFERPELKSYADFAEALADAARDETLPRFRAGAPADNKAAIGFDPVTDADREAERRMRTLIAEAYPGHGICGEEFGHSNEHAALCWVLDPIDGTRAFVCGAATWTTLIALEVDGASVVGVIDQPFTDERWVGVGGRATHARAGAKRICRASGVLSLAAARISTTDPRADGYFEPEEAAAFAELARASRLARFSFDAYAYGLLALGELDLVVEASLKRYDVAALVPVVEGAGGVITGWRGEPLAESPRGRIVAAATPALHREALGRLKSV